MEGNIQSKISVRHLSVQNTCKRLQKQLQKFDVDSRRYRMRINTNRIKTMVFSKQSMQQVGSNKLNNVTIAEVLNT